MRLIPLTQGKHAIVDEDDYVRLIQCKWYYHSTGYAKNCRYIGGGRKNQKNIITYMHRVIMNAPEDLTVDHINGNGLDNRKCNLRICTQKNNTRNKKKTTGISKYKGVTWDKKHLIWRAQIHPNKKCKYLGCYKNEEDAAWAYNEAAVKYFGDYAQLNII